MVKSTTLRFMAVSIVVGVVGCSRPHSEPNTTTMPASQNNLQEMPRKTAQHSLQKVEQQAAMSATSTDALFGKYFAEGNTMLEDGENEAAIALFTKALEMDPQSSSAYNARGVAYLRMWRSGSALEDFDKAIELAPRSAKFYANRSLALSDKEEYSRAITDITKAIELEPKSAKWYRDRGQIHFNMGNEPLARADFEIAKRLEKSAASQVTQPPNKSATRPEPASVGTGDHARVATKPPVQDDRVRRASPDQGQTFERLRAVAEDLRELTRLSDTTLSDLKILLDDYKRELDRAAKQLSRSRRDSTFATYSKALRFYEDSARIWEVLQKAPQLLEDAKRQFRETVHQRAVMQGEQVDNSDLVDGIAAFQLIIEQGHAPNNLFPPSSRFTTGLTDICQRYPRLASESRGYTFVRQGAVGSLWQEAEATLATVHLNWQVESVPPFIQSKTPRSSRLADRIAARHRELAQQQAKIDAEKQREARAAADALKERKAQEKTEKDAKAAASKVRLAQQFIDRGNSTSAKKWLEDVLRDYGHTPAAKEAKELLDSLK